MFILQFLGKQTIHFFFNYYYYDPFFFDLSPTPSSVVSYVEFLSNFLTCDRSSYLTFSVCYLELIRQSSHYVDRLCRPPITIFLSFSNILLMVPLSKAIFEKRLCIPHSL